MGNERDQVILNRQCQAPNLTTQRPQCVKQDYT